MQDQSILIIGCGKMGSALLSGWLKKGFLTPEQLVILKPTPELPQTLKPYNLSVYHQLKHLPSSFTPTIVLYAVKPAILESVLTTTALHFPTTLHLSIAAGKTIHLMEQASCPTSSIVRLMPNLPALIQHGTTVGSFNTHVTKEQQGIVKQLFEHVGDFLWVNESELDALTAIIGSGPAYLFYMIDILVDIAQTFGVSRNTAKQLVTSMCYGSTKMAQCTDLSMKGLYQELMTAGGTTEAAMHILMEQNHFHELMLNAITCAKKRANELSSNT